MSLVVFQRSLFITGTYGISCTRTSAADQLGTTGSNSDCSPGSGCVIGDPDTQSWGPDFAAAGGGVIATQFDVQGI